MEPREPIELPVEHFSNARPDDSARPFVVQIPIVYWAEPSPPPSTRFARQPRRFVPFVLFVLTCLSTFLVGGEMFGTVRILPGDPPLVELDVPSFISGGLRYSTALMAILVAHEMGHFLQARRYGVPASWPWFIPMPLSPLGTMGAVIVQASGHADRRQMFDIGISGPLAGLVVAIPVTIVGLQDSHILDLDRFGGGMTFGNPLLLHWLAEFQFGPLQANQDVALTPLLFAGWVGILITAINLIPVGQLDGGHILYGLIGRRAHAVAFVFLSSAVIWTLLSRNWSYSVMIVLMLSMGFRHPPTRDDSVPLGPFRIVLGWLTLAFLVIGFTPNPISFENRPPRAPEHIERSINVRTTTRIADRIDLARATQVGVPGL